MYAPWKMENGDGLDRYVPRACPPARPARSQRVTVPYVVLPFAQPRLLQAGALMGVRLCLDGDCMSDGAESAWEGKGRSQGKLGGGSVFGV